MPLRLFPPEQCTAMILASKDFPFQPPPHNAVQIPVSLGIYYRGGPTSEFTHQMKMALTSIVTTHTASKSTTASSSVMTYLGPFLLSLQVQCGVP